MVEMYIFLLAKGLRLSGFRVIGFFTIVAGLSRGSNTENL